MDATDPDPHERERIEGVYGDYAKSKDKRRAWHSANEGNSAIIRGFHLRVRETLVVLGRADLSESRILEVGCGTGNNLFLFKSLGASPDAMDGAEIIPARAEAARRNHPDVRIWVGDAQALPYTDAYFDIELVSVVFSSILSDETARRVAREMGRVLKPGGVIIWYDARLPNPWNPNVKRYRRSDVARLFPGFAVELGSVTLLPPLARMLSSRSIWLYRPLERIPFLRSHLVGSVCKPIQCN